MKFLREKFHIIDNTETKNYFWVNQGKRYEVEHKYSCIAATQKNLHHHKRLKEIKKGDVFIHYAHSSILATSVAIESCKIMPRPYEPDGEDCLVVKVNYSILENPIPFIDIKEIFLNKKYLLPKKGGPFNYNLGIVQSYCLSFNKPSYLAIFSKNFNNSTIMSNEPNLEYKKQGILNQILYGPPGTGKTYNTIQSAVSIANHEFDIDQDRKFINQEYDRLVKAGQIVFTTFHQSMSYEDFVEGIKPILEESDDKNENGIKYKIEDGIFKIG